MKKRIILLATLFLFSGMSVLSAQDAQQECLKKYNLFKGNYLTKNYDDAYPDLIYLMENCPTLSVNIYIYGDKLAKAKFKKATDKQAAAELVKKIYEQRVKNFPKKKIAKAHSDYATFLANNKLASDEELFPYLESAYKVDPTQMGVKNIYRYFQGVTDKNKDTNPQLVFDTYDDVLESVDEKLEDYRKKIKKLNDKVDKGGELDKREKKNLRAYSNNSSNLGLVQGGLDNIIIELSTCDRLIPLYTRDFDANKTNAKWLKRAVSRMYNKECTEDALFEKLAKAYADAEPSADAYTFVAAVLSKNGDESGAAAMRLKAFDLETDPIKKANFKLKFAQNARKKGQNSKARQLAREAIQLNPNFGNAYLFIANLYAKSLNSCGSTEFQKRMVYVAALNKVRKGMSVDPSIRSVGKKFVKNYKSQMPSKKLIFQEGIEPGSTYSIKCWIGETVKVPKY